MLNLNSNEIQKITKLDRLINLERLLLSSNKITRIEGLHQLQNLKELDLSENSITRIEGLGQLKNIEHLVLWPNNIPRAIIEQLGGWDDVEGEGGVVRNPSAFVDYCRTITNSHPID
nr:leucine-rich repeat domain-containing protein [Candidatus Sigynarchaeota archaeon]